MSCESEGKQGKQGENVDLEIEEINKVDLVKCCTLLIWITLIQRNMN